MRVLHFIPNFADIAETVGLQYKIALFRVMAESAEVHLLCADYPNVDMGSVQVHKFSPLRNLFGRWHSSFDVFLAKIRPDVVHIHSCWNIYAYYFQKCCDKVRIPTIITFDRQLETWHLSYHYWLYKFPKVFIFQRYIISHAKALHAVFDNEISCISGFNGFPSFLCKILGLKSDNIEKYHVDKLCEDCIDVEYDIYIYKQNKKVRNIVNIDIFNTVYRTSYKPMSDKILDMYQMVLDSNPFWLMNTEECRVEDILIHAGLTRHLGNQQLSDDHRRLFASLDCEAWRKILLHSYTQGVLEHVLLGIEKYKLSQPFSKKKIIEIYSFPTEKSQFVDKLICIHKTLSDTELSDIERNIIIKIKFILNGIKHRMNIKRKDVVDLYCCLKYNNFDEVRLYNKVHKIGILKDTARLFQIMKERYGLSEGFMFVEPLNDNGTKKLRKMFFKSNIQ